MCVYQATGLAGEDLAKTLEGLGLDENSEAGGDDGNILPIMQSIMQNLLSKDVLYPSLKEITEKVGFTQSQGCGSKLRGRGCVSFDRSLP